MYLGTDFPAMISDGCECWQFLTHAFALTFFVVSTDHHSLILQEWYKFGPITLISYYLCHPAPGLPMDPTQSNRAADGVKTGANFSHALCGHGLSSPSICRQMKRGRIQESTIINLIIHLCLLGFFYQRVKIMMAIKLHPELKGRALMEGWKLFMEPCTTHTNSCSKLKFSFQLHLLFVARICTFCR